MENSNIEDTAKRSAQRFQDLKGWMGEQVYYSLHPEELLPPFILACASSSISYFRFVHLAVDLSFPAIITSM